MRVIHRRTVLAFSLALAVAPAVASAGKPATPGSQGKGHAKSHGRSGATAHGHGHGRCRKAVVSKGFVASGTYGDTGSFSATPNTDGTSAGSVGFTVTHTNHHAAGATGPFAFTNAWVVFDSPTATAPAATDTVHVIGKILVAKHGCASDSAGQVTIRRVIFSAPDTATAGTTDTTDTPDAPAAPAQD